jgi:cell division septal protein FtsQ
MGSRLKGRTKRKKKASWRVHKLVVYGLLALAVMIILWYLYLWKWNPDRDTPLEKDGETTESTGGKKP